MSKATKVIDKMIEQSTKPIGNVKDLEDNANLIFKSDHKELSNVPCRLINRNEEDQTVDVKVGSANKIGVPVAALLWVQNSVSIAND